MSQMAIAWTLRNPRVTSALIGASIAQLAENLDAFANTLFSAEELATIDLYAVESGIDLWLEPSTG